MPKRGTRRKALYHVSFASPPSLGQDLLDGHEDSREPSKDAEYYTDDGAPIVLVDDNVIPHMYIRLSRRLDLNSINCLVV